MTTKKPNTKAGWHLSNEEDEKLFYAASKCGMSQDEFIQKSVMLLVEGVLDGNSASSPDLIRMADYSSKIDKKVDDLASRISSIVLDKKTAATSDPGLISGLCLTPFLKVRDPYWSEITSAVVFCAIAELFTTKGTEWVVSDIVGILNKPDILNVIGRHSPYVREILPGYDSDFIPIEMAKGMLKDGWVEGDRWEKFGVRKGGFPDCNDPSYEPIPL